MSTTEDRSGESDLPAGRQVYELGYLVLPSIPEDKLPQTVQTLKKIVADADGKELDGEDPEKRPLAYPMTKVVGASKYVVNDAYMGWFKFELDPSDINKVKEDIEKLDEILRLLIIKAPRETVYSFAMAQEAKEKKIADEQRAEEEVAEEAETDDSSDSSDEDVLE